MDFTSEEVRPVEDGIIAGEKEGRESYRLLKLWGGGAMKTPEWQLLLTKPAKAGSRSDLYECQVPKKEARFLNECEWINASPHTAMYSAVGTVMMELYAVYWPHSHSPRPPVEEIYALVFYLPSDRITPLVNLANSCFLRCHMIFHSANDTLYLGVGRHVVWVSYWVMDHIAMRSSELLDYFAQNWDHISGAIQRAV